MQRLLILLWLLANIPLSAQIINTEFPAYSAFYAISPTSDGNYVAVGSKGGGADNAKVWLAKLDAAGQILWEKTYQPAGSRSRGYSVTQAADGGFLITGVYGGNSFYFEGGFALKTAPQGSPVWSKTVGSFLYSAAQTPDGNWLIGGGGETSGSSDAVIYRFNNNGSILWQHEYPSYKYRGHFMRILPQADGTFYAAGRGEVTGAGFQGVFLVKAQSNGDTLWQRGWSTGNYIQDVYDYSLSPLGATQTTNGDILLADGSDTGGAILLRYNSSGQKIWEKYYGGIEDNISIYALAQDAAGNIFLAGSKAGENWQHRIPLLLKTNPEGIEQWTRRYPRSGPNALVGAAIRPDGTVLATGLNYYSMDGYAFLLGCDEAGYIYPRSVAINLQRDMDGNCTPSSGDLPLKSWNVLLRGDSSEYILSTDIFGNAQQRVPDGNYQLEIKTPSAHWAPCSAPQSITVGPGGSLVTLVDLMATPLADCPALAVSLTSPDLVRCERAIYHVECKNLGTTTANNARVEVYLDPMLEMYDASTAFLAGAGKYVFLLDDIPPLVAKRFWFTARLSCNAEIGQTHCVEVEAFPVPACAIPPGPDWSNASLRLSAECQGGALTFVAQNVGSGDMEAPVPYQIFADGWRMQSGEIQLDAGKFWTLDYPANGRSIRFETGQVPGHPGEDQPSIHWEGCGLTENGFASTGFTDMFEHNGRDLHRSYACVENTRQKMPDRVVGIPEGYGWYHFIPFDAKPEFVLRARNPLPQKAQQVRARIRLATGFDQSSFSVVAASHPYLIQSVDDQTFDVLFANANLPPQHEDSIASQFFLRFKVDLVPALLDTGTRLINNAHVFFNETATSALDLAYHFAVPEGFGIADMPSPYSNMEGMKVFGGSSSIDFGGDVVLNPDGSMFFLMTTYAYGTDYDLVLIKTDQNGRGLWQKVYDFDGGDVFSNAVSDGAGGLVATGYQDDPLIPSNYFNDTYLPIVRINAEGDVLWYRREKPGSGDAGKGGNANAIIRGTDGNFVITGALSNGTPNQIDNFLLKVNPEGQTLWFQNYQISGVAFYPTDVIQTPDGGYIIGGNNDSDWPNSVRFQKVDSQGNTEWSANHPFISDVTPNGMSDFAMTPDGGYFWLGYVFGYDADSNYVYWPTLTRLDSEGNYLWQKTIELGLIVYPSQLLVRPDGGCIFTGEIWPDINTQYSKLLIASTDADANLLSWNAYDANTTTYGQYLYAHPNGAYMLSGQTQTNNYLYNLAGVLLQTDSDGVLGFKPSPAPTATPRLMVWPNPARQFAQVLVPGEGAKGPFVWELLDVEGKIVARGQSAQPDFRVENPDGGQGIFHLSVRWKGGWATRPVMFSGR